MSFKYLLLYLTILVFGSCQKSIDQPLPSDGTEDDDTAIFVFQNVQVLGNYVADSVLTLDHLLNVSLHVTAAGDYTATTAEKNGIRFSMQGTFSDTGDVQIRVPASGTPLQAGIFDFTLEVNGQTFPFQVNVLETTVETGQWVNPPPDALATQYDTYGIFDYVRTFMKYQAGTTLIRQIVSNYHPQIDITYNSKNLINETTHGYEGQSKNVYQYVYYENDRVSKIMARDANNQFTIEAQVFTWNQDGTLHTENSGPGDFPTEYLYADGNLTGIPGGGDTTLITYDTRTNHFSQIYPQHYFLDQITLYGNSDLAAALYFSKNYPVTFGIYTVSVTEDANGRPIGVYLDGEQKYGYGYD